MEPIHLLNGLKRSPKAPFLFQSARQNGRHAKASLSARVLPLAGLYDPLTACENPALKLENLTSLAGASLVFWSGLALMLLVLVTLAHLNFQKERASIEPMKRGIWLWIILAGVIAVCCHPGFRVPGFQGIRLMLLSLDTAVKRAPFDLLWSGLYSEMFRWLPMSRTVLFAWSGLFGALTLAGIYALALFIWNSRPAAFIAVCAVGLSSFFLNILATDAFTPWAAPLPFALLLALGLGLRRLSLIAFGLLFFFSVVLGLMTPYLVAPVLLVALMLIFSERGFPLKKLALFFLMGGLAAGLTIHARLQGDPLEAVRLGFNWPLEWISLPLLVAVFVSLRLTPRPLFWRVLALTFAGALLLWTGPKRPELIARDPGLSVVPWAFFALAAAGGIWRIARLIPANAALTAGLALTALLAPHISAVLFSEPPIEERIYRFQAEGLESLLAGVATLYRPHPYGSSTDPFPDFLVPKDRLPCLRPLTRLPSDSARKTGRWVYFGRECNFEPAAGGPEGTTCRSLRYLYEIEPSASQSFVMTDAANETRWIETIFFAKVVRQRH